MSDPLIRTIEVPCAPDEAFRIFTADFGRWWPGATHSVSAGQGGSPVAIHLEARIGGLIAETAPDGSRHDWGRIDRFDPGRALSFTWHPGRPAGEATRVEIAFEAVPNGTRVTLVHSGWEVLGEAAPGIRDRYRLGWGHVLGEAFARACAAPARA